MRDRLILAGFLLGVTVLALINGSLNLSSQWLQLIWLPLGGVVGWNLIWLDVVAFVYILHPEAQVSQYVQFQLNNRRFRKALEMVRLREGEFDKLTTKSVLFQIAWVVLTIFTLTSTAGWFGKTMLMALGLHILVDAWELYLKDKEALKKELFWQIKRPFSDRELKGYLYILTGMFLWFVLMLV
jgi:hypothetical protein